LLAAPLEGVDPHEVRRQAERVRGGAVGGGELPEEGGLVAEDFVVVVGFEGDGVEWRVKKGDAFGGRWKYSDETVRGRHH